ncbi:MAG: glycosyltransferase family 4 protein [Oscillospiraceae bacterium]|jgi:glycosyltransferase involved in cell wall biosynthesis|nr:glycosyltransferase family 4 protein [Oscillospiraceae bacterium]
MKLALAAPYDITDPAAWSGTPFSLHSALLAQAGQHTVATVNVAALLPSGGRAEQLALLRGLDVGESLRRRTPVSHAGTAWRNPMQSKALCRWLQQEKPDVLLQFGGYRTKASGIPYFIYSDSTHELSIRFHAEHPELYAQLYPGRAPMDSERAAQHVQPIYEEADGIFCMSRWMADSLQRTGTDPAKLQVVYAAPNFHGAPPPQVQAKSLGGRQTYRLLFIGVDFFRKSGDLITEALRQLNADTVQPRFTIDFAGPTSVPPEIASLPFVRSHGFCDKAKLAALLAAADLFVMPSRFDCFGIAFLEAMRYGLPCIGRNICAMPEFIQPGVNGELLQSNDAAELAAHIQKVLHPAAYTAYSQAALERAQQYQWAAIAASMWQRFEATV